MEQEILSGLMEIQRWQAKKKKSNNSKLQIIFWKIFCFLFRPKKEKKKEAFTVKKMTEV